MLGRAKIEAALSAQGTEEFGVVVPYEGILARDHWEQFTAFPWWVQASPDPVHQYSWRRDLILTTGSDWFVLPEGAPREEQDNVLLLTFGEQVLRLDRRTGCIEVLERPQVGGWTARPGQVQSVHVERLPTTEEEIDRLLPLPLAEDPRRVRIDGCGAAAALLLQEFGRSRYPIQQIGGPLWHAYSLWGFEGMMTLVAERKELVRFLCERACQRSEFQVRRAAAMGVAGIWIEDCLTDLISPAAFAELNLPYLQRLTDAIRKEGMHSIYYYCGDPSGKWEHLLAVGADALSLEESKKGFRIDIAEVVARVNGRCAVLGNLDAIGVLQDGSEEELRAEIARQIEAGRRNGGRFIMSLGSPVTPGTPMQRVRLFCDLAHELGAR
ncbi:MAG: hypothetical protein H5T69_15165 [Chloroflexi bacterium]|nr:hypothetical protein [Chloroflexota bacterium]